ncbi:uncharacterized protein MELLADRAFT_71138 [Melampsora larici-populina 98AG31]|uniref:Secreted protein n=1 Tax=Melampsora larici-populina (strain 98AG31 / pathotype 3-4-7) TaxID=747676 RepID=F4RCM6_MELLP|nr:uncharacterized protein MELLADRAFT_71138 [Melampsora larici-populina 98AG31]EGG09763.1 secreted protein [Melampsora larici-populina 98AG31]
MQGLLKTLILLAAFTYNVAQAETCKKQIDVKECQKAIDQIGYDTKGNVVKTVNKQVLSSGHCKVTIQTKKGGPISTSGSGLSAALDRIVSRKNGECKNQPGVEDIQNPTNIAGFQPATLLVEYIDDKAAPAACKHELDPKECQKALGQIGYDTKGNVLKTVNKQVLSCGHCKVTIQTKKGGPIANSGSGLSEALNKVLDHKYGECKNQPGVEDILNPTNINNFQTATLLVERIEGTAAPCA